MLSKVGLRLRVATGLIFIFLVLMPQGRAADGPHVRMIVVDSADTAFQMLVALNRGEELALHLRAAKNNGVTREQIKEVLLQTAIYCGVPAANSAFHLADRLFREEDTAQP